MVDVKKKIVARRYPERSYVNPILDIIYEIKNTYDGSDNDDRSRQTSNFNLDSEVDGSV